MRKIAILFILLVSALVCSANIAYASTQLRGTSLGELNYSCDYYLIEDSYGDYTLAEWYGGGLTPDSGDIVYGDLHSYGFKDLYNSSRDRTTRAWIDDYMLSEDSATEKLIDHCGWDREILNYFSGGYSYSSQTTNYSTAVIPPPMISCPANSSLNYSDSKCYCNSGYSINGGACVVTVVSPYQNVIDHKIYREVRMAYAYNSDKGCEKLALAGEDLSMCRAFATDTNKDRWITIDKIDTTVTAKSLLEKNAQQRESEQKVVAVQQEAPVIQKVAIPQAEAPKKESIVVPSPKVSVDSREKKEIHKVEKSELNTKIITATSSVKSDAVEELKYTGRSEQLHWYEWLNPFSWFK